jgi:hypothetical protein
MSLHSLTIERGGSHLPGLPGRLDRRRLGDHPQIVGNHAPAYPPFHPGSPVIAAPSQLVAPFQAAAAPCKARSPIASPSEPALLFVGEPLARFGSGLGQHHVLDAVGRRIPLVGDGVAPAIPCEQAGRPLEDTQMMFQAGRQLGILGRMALQNGVPADHAALDFVPPDPAPTFRGASRLPLADDRGLRLKQAHDFLCRWHHCPRAAPAGRLGDPLADQRDEGGHSGSQVLALGGGLGAADRPPVLGVLSGHLRDGAQVLIRRTPPGRRLRATLPGRLHDAFPLALGTACAIPLGLAGHPGGLLKDRSGLGPRPAEHPHTIIEPRASGRVMDRRFSHRPVKPQLAAPRDLARPRQCDDVVEQPGQRGGLDQGRPPAQRRIVGPWRHRHSAALAQDQAITAPEFGGLIAPAIQMLDHQQGQDNLDRRRRPAGGRGVGKASRQVRLNNLQ